MSKTPTLTVPSYVVKAEPVAIPWIETEQLLQSNVTLFGSRIHPQAGGGELLENSKVLEAEVAATGWPELSMVQ